MQNSEQSSYTCSFPAKRIDIWIRWRITLFTECSGATCICLHSISTGTLWQLVRYKTDQPDIRARAYIEFKGAIHHLYATDYAKLSVSPHAFKWCVNVYCDCSSRERLNSKLSLKSDRTCGKWVDSDSSRRRESDSSLQRAFLLVQFGLRAT